MWLAVRQRTQYAIVPGVRIPLTAVLSSALRPVLAVCAGDVRWLRLAALVEGVAQVVAAFGCAVGIKVR